MKFLAAVFITFLFVAGKPKKEIISFMNEPSFSVENLKVETIYFNDTNGVDSILLMKGKDGLPHSYCRRFISEVCIDKECRALDVFIFWTVTGRYLGFEIPEGEFFSKSEHEPFLKNDYEKLHALLSDENSILQKYSIIELLPDDEEEVDAVSSATISEVKDYVVENAVYTTYTLWHLVYGNTRNEIDKISKSRISTDLLLRLLSSHNQHDIGWGLDNITDDIVWTDSLSNKMIQLLKNENLTVADKAIRQFRDSLLVDEDMQLQFFEGFDEGGYLIKRKMLKKMEAAPFLHPDIEKQLVTKLPVLNGSLIKNTLELFAVHGVNRDETEFAIARLLKHDNRYIAKKAFQFFESSPSDNKKVNRMIKKYRH